jgi:hypothetical protein
MRNKLENSAPIGRREALKAGIMATAALGLVACLPNVPELPPEYPFKVREGLEKDLSFFDRDKPLLSAGTVLVFASTERGAVTAGQGALVSNNGKYSVATIAHVTEGIHEKTGKMALYIPHVGLTTGNPKAISTVYRGVWSDDRIHLYDLPPNLSKKTQAAVDEKKLAPIKMNLLKYAVGQWVAIPNVYGGKYSIYRVTNNDENQLLRLKHVQGPLLCQGNSGAPVLRAHHDGKGGFNAVNEMFGLIKQEVRGTGGPVELVDEFVVRCAYGVDAQRP